MPHPSVWISLASLVLMGIGGCSKSPTETSPSPTNNQQSSRDSVDIAYCIEGTQLSDHAIYGINAGGSSAVKLINASIGLNHVDWSPDGNNLVAVGYMDATATTWSLHTFGVDGKNLKRITSITGVADSEPAWSPDGTKIALTRIFWGPDGQFSTGRNELWVVNADGSDPHFIGVEGFASKWSPDGGKLIYSSRRSGNYEIYTCLANGTNEQRLTNTAADETYPVWSPDGKQIAYCASTGNYFSVENSATYEIYLANSDGTNVKRLTNNSFYDGYPRWSPDGKRLVFGSDRDGRFDVYIMNVDDGIVRRLTFSTARAMNAVWRPTH